MSYASPKHHAKHRRISGGDNSYHEYQVYATTTEPMPNQSHRSWEYPNVDFTFNKNYKGQRIVDTPPRAEIMECEFYPQLVETINKYQVDEDVDREAEDFIKLEHKQFARSKTSMFFKTDWERVS